MSWLTFLGALFRAVVFVLRFINERRQRGVGRAEALVELERALDDIGERADTARSDADARMDADGVYANDGFRRD